jgi:hypothetical protein
MNEIKLGLYKHYKGKMYKVIGIGRHSETLEEYVIYQALYENEYGKNSIWMRPKSMFVEEIEVEGKKMPRFTYISEAQ